MSGYIGNIPTPQATQSRQNFIATAGQTSFATIGYTPNFLDVYLNGSHLLNGTDYTATNSSDVVLTVAADAADVIEVISYTTFQVLDQSLLGTTTVVDLDVTGVLTTTAATVFNGGITMPDNARTILGDGSDLQIYHDPAGPSNYIEATAGEGDLVLKAGNQIRLQQSDGDDLATFNEDGSVQLYYDDAVKIETSSTGAGITGRLETSANNNDGAKANYIRITDTDVTATEGNHQGGIEFFSNDVTPGISASIEVVYAGAGGGGQITFNTNATSQGTLTEAVRIDETGSLLVGTVSTPENGSSGIELDPLGFIRLSRVGSTTKTHAVFDNSNGTVGSITTLGTATTYATSSDYRLKTDAQPMTGASARVQALNPVNFEWIVDGARTDGFLAHEAQAVVPEAVVGAKDAMKDQRYEVTPAIIDENGTETTPAVMGTRSVPDMQGIDQSKLVPLLTAALREALTKIDEMEVRIAALEG